MAKWSPWILLIVLCALVIFQNARISSLEDTVVEIETRMEKRKQATESRASNKRSKRSRTGKTGKNGQSSWTDTDGEPGPDGMVPEEEVMQPPDPEERKENVSNMMDEKLRKREEQQQGRVNEIRQKKLRYELDSFAEDYDMSDETMTQTQLLIAEWAEERSQVRQSVVAGEMEFEDAQEILEEGLTNLEDDLEDLLGEEEFELLRERLPDWRRAHY